MVELIITICVILIILYMGRVGADFGVFFELTSSLLLFFAMFVTLRYWYLVTDFIQTRTFIKGANATFVAYWLLFLVGCIPLMAMLKFVNEDARPTYPAAIEMIFGFGFGLVSAAIVFCCVMTSVSVMLPKLWEPYERTALLLPLDEMPLQVYRYVEQDWLGISTNNPAHTRLPTLDKGNADNFDKYWR